MTELRTAAQQALAFTLRDFASLRDFEAAKAVLYDTLRAALAQQAEPDLSRCPQCNGPADNGFDRSIPPSPYLCTKCMAEPVEPAAWLRVIDEAMVTHHLGVADLADDYETAKRKMNNLLCMAQDIGAYFARPQRPAESVPEPVAECIDDICAKHFGRVEAFDHLTTGTKLYTAPPQRLPLTEEEILEAVGWERAEMYMKLTPNFPVEEARKETIKNARAIERKVRGEKT